MFSVKGRQSPTILPQFVKHNIQVPTRKLVNHALVVVDTPHESHTDNNQSQHDSELMDDDTEQAEPANSYIASLNGHMNGRYVPSDNRVGPRPLPRLVDNSRRTKTSTVSTPSSTSFRMPRTVSVAQKKSQEDLNSTANTM